MSAEKKERLGILGGTFDPPHNGHLHMAETARDYLGLSRVFLVPSGNSYMKKNVSDAETRLMLTKLAVMGRKGLSVSDEEVRRGGNSYSYETVLSFHERFPEAVLFFLVGEDTLYMMEKWYRPEPIFAGAKIAVSIREDGDKQRLEKKSEELRARYGADITLIPMKPFPCASSDIRMKLEHHEEVSALLPKRVLAYIRENALYIPREPAGYTEERQDRILTGQPAEGISPGGSPLPEEDGINAHGADAAKDAPGNKELVEALSKRLKESRFAHTLSVAYTAGNLAALYGASVEKAVRAGLLHDIAKPLSDEELMRYCFKNGLPVSEAEKRAPYLLHGKVGARIAEEEFGETDPEILAAITWHTTGRPGMSLLEKIIFIADYIEPFRYKQKKLGKRRRQAFSDPDRALLGILKDTVKYLNAGGLPVDPMTEKTLNYYRG